MRPDVPSTASDAARLAGRPGARAGLALAVLAAHAAVLWAVWAAAQRPAGQELPADAPRVAYRLVLLPTPTVTAPAQASDGPAKAAPPRPTPKTPTTPTDAPPQAAPAGAVAASPVPAAPADPGALATAAPPTQEPPAAAGLHWAAAGAATDAAVVAVSSSPAAEAGEAPPPTYATRLPGPATLRYTMRRGGLSGQGVLHWRLLPEVAPPGATGGPSYRLDFVGRAFGALLLGWHSQGRVDAHGLAPDRFVDRRRQRGAVAANFQRGRGIISYSGEGEDVPLMPGAQDRLSWMVQLPAIVAARPALAQPGATVAMQVTGARGDADEWTFRVVDRQDLQLPVGAVPQALHLRREPRKPRDTRVEVWLDPARQWLPVRLRLSPAEGGDGTEFLLSGEGGPPPEGPPN